MEGALHPPWSGGPTADILIKGFISNSKSNNHSRILCTYSVHDNYVVVVAVVAVLFIEAYGFIL